MMALKLARAAGCKVILTSSSDEKLDKVKQLHQSPPLLTVNYARIQDWENKVLQLSGGVGVDIVLENGGTSSLVKSVRCTRRGGVVSQVGYLARQNPLGLADLLPVLIDRRVDLR